MYRNDWHQAHQEKTRLSAELVAALMRRYFAVESVLDVGCGQGDWLNAFVDLGVEDVFGCDGPWTDQQALVIRKDRFATQDFRQPFSLGRSFDLIISTEVAEHFEERYAEQFVRSIVAHGDLVLFGAAIPYQGGFRHVNEQWPSWWAQLFRRSGYEAFDIVRPALWEDPHVHFWYKQNALVYVKAARADLVAQAEEAFRGVAKPSQRLDIVHPEKFVELASYRSIAFKPLARELPRAVTSKLRSMLTGGRPA